MLQQLNAEFANEQIPKMQVFIFLVHNYEKFWKRAFSILYFNNKHKHCIFMPKVLKSSTIKDCIIAFVWRVTFSPKLIINKCG